MTCGQQGQFSLLFSQLSVSHNLFTFTQCQSAGFLLFLMASNVCIYLKDPAIMYFTFVPTWESVSLSVWPNGPCQPMLQSKWFFFDWKCFDLIDAQAAQAQNQLSVSKCIFYTVLTVTEEWLTDLGVIWLSPKQILKWKNKKNIQSSCGKIFVE